MLVFALGCLVVLFGFVVFLFSEVGGSFRLECSSLSIVGMSEIVLLSCSLFSGVFLVFQGQKTKLSLLLS